MIKQFYFFVCVLSLSLFGANAYSKTESSILFTPANLILRQINVEYRIKKDSLNYGYIFYACLSDRIGIWYGGTRGTFANGFFLRTGVGYYTKKVFKDVNTYIKLDGRYMNSNPNCWVKNIPRGSEQHEMCLEKWQRIRLSLLLGIDSQIKVYNKLLLGAYLGCGLGAAFNSEKIVATAHSTDGGSLEQFNYLEMPIQRKSFDIVPCYNIGVLIGWKF